MTPPDGSMLPTRARTPYGAPTAVSPRLLASWRRSEDYGVDLDEVDPVWTGTYAGDSLLLECGAEVLTGMHQTLANEPISLMLADADGLVFNRLSGDTSVLRALDVRSRTGARPELRPARGLRQHHDRGQVVERPAPRAGPVRRREHLRADARPVARPPPQPG